MGSFFNDLLSFIHDIGSIECLTEWEVDEKQQMNLILSIWAESDPNPLIYFPN